MPSDDANKDVYDRPEVVALYDGFRGLQLGEKALLEDVDDVVRGGRVLDIGIGGGRTVEPLVELAGEYVGLDYSQVLVDVAKQDHPGVRIEWGDARDLSAYEDGSFDFALFSYNGIDSVPHEDRLQIMREAHRVLRAGGVFAFSTHNRDYERFNLMPWERQLRFGRRTIKRSLKALPYVMRHRRMRAQEVHTDEYAVINDEAHDYTLMHYYIRPADQIAQLERLGFTDVVGYDMQGRRGLGDDPASVWIYYTARR